MPDTPDPDIPRNRPLYGALEAGGTKFVVCTGTGPDDLRDVTRIPTTTPAETLGAVIRYFQEAAEQHGPLTALGVGTFGPAGVHPESPDYGWITTTPKPGWAQTEVRGALLRALGVPVGFDTDVNAAALAEWRWGAGQGCGSLLYLTVGTGIGGGLVLAGQPVHGLVHPEMGHVRLPRLSGDDFPGCCPWHGDCLEGMASGTALQARWGPEAARLPPDHGAWQIEADALAQACVTFLCTVSPERIVLGGGVMEQAHLFPLIRERAMALLGGYLRHPRLDEGMTDWILPPGLGSHSGLAGALALAEIAARQEIPA